MKFVVTDVMDPVLSVAKLTEQGFKVEFEQQACFTSQRDVYMGRGSAQAFLLGQQFKVSDPDGWSPTLARYQKTRGTRDVFRSSHGSDQDCHGDTVIAWFKKMHPIPSTSGHLRGVERFAPCMRGTTRQRRFGT